MMLTKLQRVCCFVGFITLTGLIATAADTSVFQVRLVLDAPAAGSEQMTFQGIDGTASTFNVQKMPLLDLMDVESASVIEGNGTAKPMIKVTLTPAGSKRLQEASKANIHRRIAVVVDGKILSTPVIQAELTGPNLPITGNYSSELAKDLVVKINAGLGK
jgi:preprotein translocase subunit SecD